MFRKYWFVLVSLALFTKANAAPSENWDILVLPLYHQATLDKNHPAYRRIDGDIRQQLSSEGFRVLNADSIGLEVNCELQDCSPEGKGLLISQIRTLNEARNRRNEAPVDLLWYFEITGSKRSGAAADRFVFSVFSQLVDLKEGVDIDNWRDLPQERPYSARARGETVIDWEATEVFKYGRNAASALIEKLLFYDREQDYMIRLNDFTTDELEGIQYFIKTDAEYQEGSLEVLGSLVSRKELLHNRASLKFRLRSTLNRTELISSLLSAIESAGAGSPLSNGDGETIILTRASMPYVAAYLGAIAALVVLLLVIVIIAAYRRHDRNLTYIHNNANASQGVDYLSSKATILPHKARWDAWAEEWNININEAEGHVLSAEQAAAEHDYEKAKDDVTRALEANSDNEKAQQLRKDIPEWEKGYKLFRIAEAELQNEPSAAAKRLSEAEDLNPFLKKRIDDLKDQADQIFRQGDLASNISQAKTRITDNKPYEAIAKVDEALHSISDLPGFTADIDQLNSLRKEAIALIEKLTANLKGSGDLATTRFLTNDEIKLGRLSSAGGGDIMLGYKRLSRPGKQTRIYRTGSGYAIQDQDSTNGTMIDGRALKKGESSSVNGATRLAMGGSKESGALGSCQLLATPANQSRNSLVIEFDQSSLILLDRTALTEAWPTLEQDATSIWALVGESVAIGVHEGKFDIGCLRADAPAFILIHDNGWHITPAQNGQDSGVRIDGAPLLNIAPLTSGIRVDVEGLWFTLEQDTP